MDYQEEIKSLQKNINGEPESDPLDLSPNAIAQTIDHTLLKTDATPEQIDSLCREAIAYAFKTVCVRLPYVSRAKKNLSGFGVGVCCVVGFHEGTYSTDEKIKEGKAAREAGATELDTVLNRSHVASGTDLKALATELKAIRAAAPAPTKLKLILETARLNEDQITAATVVAYDAGFDFVKTSTGFDGEGATVPNVKLMRGVADALEDKYSRHMEVKASGGVRSFADAEKMLRAGASRLGASAGVAIVQQAESGKSEAAPGSAGY